MTPYHNFSDSMLPGLETIKSNKKIKYLNVASGADIETTSLYNNGEKMAFMYVWMIGIGYNGPIIYGRHFSEMVELINQISDYYELHEEFRLPIYVHNLGYEFQFMRHHFDWFEIFAVGDRKPIRAITTHGIEFRDSLILSGYSLAGTARNLTHHNVKKLVGDLDYSLTRHHNTPLTPEELGYCKNDIQIITAYIDEQMDLYGNVDRIPMTNTGRVRRYVRDMCHYTVKGQKKSRGKYVRYRQIMADLTLDKETYQRLKTAFMGGFTHASASKSGVVIRDVDSVDISSSYPTVMVGEYFPMSRAKNLHVESYAELVELSKKYCLIFDLKLKGVQNKIGYESYISESKCRNISGATIDNGRIHAAKEFTTTITDVDFQIISAVYSWDEIEVANVIGFHKGRLPKSIVESILELYVDKTELKGIESHAVEYMLSKGMLNSVYGMSVTDVLQDSHEYSGGEWYSDEIDVDDEIKNYNESRNRFLYYPWGIWVTAYARRNVWKAIIALGEDYIYCDTDSIKFTNYEKHKQFFIDYNAENKTKLSRAVSELGLDVDKLNPKNNQGERLYMGIWDYEGHYDSFKTLGAKRYMYLEKGKHHLVVAGLSKQDGMKYIEKTNGPDSNAIFAAFTDELYIPRDATGKMTHTYIDEMMLATVEDYQGNVASVSSASAIHLEPCEFTLSIAEQYRIFLRNLTQGYIFQGVKFQ